jgi:hypothetical protein
MGNCCPYGCQPARLVVRRVNIEVETTRSSSEACQITLGNGIALLAGFDRLVDSKDRVHTL